MMINRYRTTYPNHYHQLFVTPSKHLYVLKDGRVKWQSKPMETSLDRIGETRQEHIVHYILADHASAAFYAEMRTSKSLTGPAEFLQRAWAKKADFFFHGLPEFLVVPATVAHTFPEIDPWVMQMDVVALAPSSGFAAGVHHVKNWERELAFTVRSYEYRYGKPCTLDDLQNSIANTLNEANKREILRNGARMTRRQLWELEIDGRPAIRPFAADR
jgi:hypothetical protein